MITDSPFFLQVIEGIDRQAKAEGFNLMISYFNTNSSTEEFARLEENGCRGIILLATEMCREEILPFQKLNIPLIALDGNFEDAEVNCVSISNVEAMRRATQHLTQLGHKKIGYLKSSEPIRNFAERFEGYRIAMQEAELEIEESGIIESLPSAEDAYRAMKEKLLACGVEQTAFVAENDNILFGAMKALREYNIAVPERVSVVGFDDMPLAEVYDPPLTTIQVPKRQMGSVAVSLMASLVKGPFEAPIRITVGSKLVVRKSTAPPAVG